MAERPRPGGDTAVVVPKTKPEKETRRPPLYKVLLHNDDYTTQEFVDWVLDDASSTTTRSRRTASC